MHQEASPNLLDQFQPTRGHTQEARGSTVLHPVIPQTQKVTQSDTTEEYIPDEKIHKTSETELNETEISNLSEKVQNNGHKNVCQSHENDK